MLNYTYFSGSVTQTDGGQVETVPDLDTLADRLRALARPVDRKGGAGYIVPCAFAGRRAAANAQPTALVALDCDVEDHPIDWADLAGLDYVAHTTDSHLRVCEQNPGGGERWRVFLRLAEPRSAADWPASPWPWAVLRSIAQPAFLPTAPDVTWRRGRGAGARLPTPGSAPAIVPSPVIGVRLLPAQETIDRFRLRWHDDPRDTNRLAGTLGAILASGGWSDGEIADGFAAWFTHPDLRRHTRSALAAAARRRAGDRVMGFPEYEQLTGRPWRWVEQGDDLSWAAPAESPASDDSLLRAVGGTWVRGDALVRAVIPPRWLVRHLGLAPGRYCGLAGSGGVGKTWFAQGLALAVARGEPFCGLPVRQGPVLHIDHEQGAEMTKERYQLLGLSSPCPDLEFVSFPSWRLSGRDGKQLLGRMAQGRALLIIDSLRASIVGDENASEVRTWLDQASDVSDRTGCTVLVLHHARKQKPNEEVEDPYYESRGSSAITDAAGSFWVLKRGRKTAAGREPDTLHQTKPGRHAEEDVVPAGTPFLRQRDGDRIRLVLGESEELDERRAEADAKQFEAATKRVLKLLATRPRSLSELARVLRVRRQLVSDIAGSLIDSGRAEKTGGGQSCVLSLVDR